MPYLPLRILGVLFFIAAIYIGAAVSDEIRWWPVLLALGASLSVIDIELQRLKDRLKKLEAGTSAPVAAPETEEV